MIKMKLMWFGTAGFQVKTDSVTVLIDPYLSRPPAAKPEIALKPEEVTNADYIFLSHGHFDHSIDVGTIAKQTGATIYCSKKASETFLKEDVPENQIHVISDGDVLDFDLFTVTVIRSKHIKFGLTTLLWKFFSWKVLKSIRSFYSLIRNYPKGDVFGFHFNLKKEALTFCHFGSGGYYQEELEKFQPDLFLAPLAGRRNAPKVLAKMAKFLKPKIIIPHHWDDFYPPFSWCVSVEDFELEVKTLLSNAVIKVLEPLQEIEIQSIT